jgi:hypothetical protein
MHACSSSANPNKPNQQDLAFRALSIPHARRGLPPPSLLYTTSGPHTPCQSDHRVYSLSACAARRHKVAARTMCWCQEEQVQARCHLALVTEGSGARNAGAERGGCGVGWGGGREHVEGGARRQGRTQSCAGGPDQPTSRPPSKGSLRPGSPDQTRRSNHHRHRGRHHSPFFSLARPVRVLLGPHPFHLPSGRTLPPAPESRVPAASRRTAHSEPEQPPILCLARSDQRIRGMPDYVRSGGLSAVDEHSRHLSEPEK